MSYVTRPEEGLNYYPCRYGRSRMRFRGPRRSLSGRYVAFIGGTDTYGRFVPHPYPSLVERKLGIECVNFGCVNAGLDAFLNDPEVMRAAEAADIVVLQVLGAQNMSNRFYSVHPRRNDRFLKASKALKRMCPKLDFTDIHFTRHLLTRLQESNPDRFEEVVEELQEAWVSRMKHFCTLLGGKVILVWIAGHAPQNESNAIKDDGPLFVTAPMLGRIRLRVSDSVELVPDRHAISERTAGMVFADYEQEAASNSFGPVAHQAWASELSQKLVPLM